MVFRREEGMSFEDNIMGSHLGQLDCKMAAVVLYPFPSDAGNNFI